MELNTKPSKMWRIYLDIEEEELIWGLRGQRISPIRLMDLTEKYVALAREKGYNRINIIDHRGASLVVKEVDPLPPDEDFEELTEEVPPEQVSE